MKECPCCKNVTGNFGLNKKLCRQCSPLKPRTRYLRYNYGSAYQGRFRVEDVLAKICPVCDKAFSTTHKSKVYCSDVCGRKRYRKLHGKDCKKRYEQKYPQKHSAQRSLAKAVLSGQIRKLPFCELCLKTCQTHAHHTDYSKPLFVYWLCPGCHVKVHKNKLPGYSPESYFTSPLDILGESTEDCLFSSI